jgi:hypothetical protein
MTVVIEDDGVAVDITGATLAAAVLEPDGTTVNNPAAVVSDGPNGKLTVTMVVATWPEEGDFILQIKLTLSGAGNRVKRTKRIPIHVLPTIGAL